MIYQNRKEYFSVKITNNNNYLAHMHRQVELFYVLDGAIEIMINGQTMLLEKGMTSIAFPNVVHETHTPESSSAIMIIFNEDFLPDYINEFTTQSPKSPFISSPCESERLETLMHELLACQQSNEKSASQTSLMFKNTDIRRQKGYLYVILSIILSELTLIKQEKIPTDICQSISSYMNMHFTEDISLSSLAAALGYSKYHISHIFNERFGCSYNDYLKRLRAEHAMGLLTHSDMTVTDVCFASGFNSQRTFYRAFNEVYGIAPKAVSHNVVP